MTMRSYERRLSEVIRTLKNKQAELRREYLDLDVKIIALRSKISASMATRGIDYEKRQEKWNAHKRRIR